MKHGQTPLVLAARHQQWDTVSKLLDSGATNLDAKDVVSFLEAIAIYYVY